VSHFGCCFRLRGPNITPGYWRRPDLTREAFDAEGFYKLGGALKFADPNDPAQGLLFDGRLAEDFKLSTGTGSASDHCAAASSSISPHMCAMW
jgi:long-subunit acyl-CoA synthetase (AMP-forming)